MDIQMMKLDDFRFDTKIVPYLNTLWSRVCIFMEILYSTLLAFIDSSLKTFFFTHLTLDGSCSKQLCRLH